MRAMRTFRKACGIAVFMSLAGAVPPAWADAGELVVKESAIDDLKAVFATVRSKDRIEARVRTPGTVVSLKVAEGAHVTPGQQLALVADPKIALRMRAIDAQIVGIQSKLATAKTEFERADQLLARGVSSQQRVDQAKTAYDLAANELKSVLAERQVAEQQVAEGQVLAPAEGRVLRVPVTEGAVVMAGESIATIAANQYVLKLEVPERHARFMKKDDVVRVGARGLSAASVPVAASGKITEVYPELQGGRVIADAEVAGLGDYFVGERALVWISAGKRTTIVVPRAYTFERHGIDFVRVIAADGKPIDVVVQLGQQIPADGGPEQVEILSGLKPGDRIIPSAERRS